MGELEHEWRDVGTTAVCYWVESPRGGIMNPVGMVGSPDDEIRFKRTGENTIEIYNATSGNWWSFEWDINSWIGTDTKWIGYNANF